MTPSTEYNALREALSHDSEALALLSLAVARVDLSGVEASHDPQAAAGLVVPAVLDAFDVPDARRGQAALELRDAVRTVWASADRGRPSVREHARRTYRHRRTLGRHLRDAGLPAGQVLLRGLQIVRALLIHQRGRTLARAAEATGWPNPFTLSSRMHELSGLRPSRADWRAFVDAWGRQYRGGA